MLLEPHAPLARSSACPLPPPGCTLASAIAAELAKGQPLLAAVCSARSALQRALAGSTRLSLGSGVQRPFHHLFMLDAAAAAAPLGAAARTDPGVLRAQLRLYAVTDPHCNRKHSRCARVQLVGAARRLTGARGGGVHVHGMAWHAAVLEVVRRTNAPPPPPTPPLSAAMSCCGVGCCCWTRPRPSSRPWVGRVALMWSCVRLPNHATINPAPTPALHHRRLPPPHTHSRSVVDAVRLAVQGGATIVQLRDKGAEGGDFARDAAAVLEVSNPAW